MKARAVFAALLLPALIMLAFCAFDATARAVPVPFFPLLTNQVFPAPTLTSVLPLDCVASGGETVQVTGTNLNVGSATITIGSLSPVALTALSPTTGTFICPAYTTSAGISSALPISVTTTGGTASLSGSFGGGGMTFLDSTTPTVVHTFGGRWTVSGSAVTSWTNLVPGENSPAQSTSTHQCSVVSNWHNSLSAVACNAGLASSTPLANWQGLEWSFATPLSAPAPISVYVVVQLISDATIAPGNAILWQIGTSDVSNIYLFLAGPHNDAANPWTLSTPSGGFNSTTVTDFDAHAIVAVTPSDGGSNKSRITVDTDATTGTIVALSNFNGFNSLGAAAAIASGALFSPTNMVIAEELVRNGQDSTGTQTEILAALATQWGP